MAKTKENQSAEWTKTEAYKNFENNLDHLVRMLNIIPTADLKKNIVSMKRLTKKISREVNEAKEALSKAPDSLQRTLSDLTVDINDIVTGITEYTQKSSFLWAWNSVILVTFVEAYMEEGLEFIAGKNLDLLKNTDPLSFERIVKAESLEDLKLTFGNNGQRKPFGVGQRSGQPS